MFGTRAALRGMSRADLVRAAFDMPRGLADVAIQAFENVNARKGN